MATYPEVQFPVPFAYGTPGEVVFGNGVSRTVGERITALGAGKVVFIADSGVHSAGLHERVAESLRAANIEFHIFITAPGEPTDLSVQKAVDLIMDVKPDAVIGMGGGSAMDTAKAAAPVSANGGSVIEHIHHRGRLKKAGPPVIAMTTTSGTGAEVTPTTVITDTARKYKDGISGTLCMPRLSICDPELTIGMPVVATANAGIDVLCHCIEAYTNMRFNPFSDTVALQGIRIVGRYLCPAVTHGHNLAVRWQMMWAANLGGLAIAHGGVADIHAFAGPVSGHHGIAHGRAIAILMPHIMAFTLPAAIDRYADIAEALGEPVAGLSRIAAAECAVTSVRRLVADCGGAQRLSELGVGEEHIDVMARDGFGRGSRANNARICGADDVATLYRAAL